jgi:DNA-binding CsgD family transcriptional regulator
MESSAIFVLPLIINELLKVNFHRQANYVFGVLFLCGLACLVAPYFLGVLKNGTPIESLTGFKIYRSIFVGSFLYTFTIFGLQIKNINDTREKNFYISAVIILMVLLSQTIFPVIKSFPENLVVYATGYFYLNASLLKYLVNRFFDFSKPPLTIPINELMTNREKEILTLLEQGLSNKDIGVNLSITETTVKSHIQNIYKKLGVSNRVQLINRLRSTDSFMEAIHNPK